MKRQRADEPFADAAAYGSSGDSAIPASDSRESAIAHDVQGQERVPTLAEINHALARSTARLATESDLSAFLSAVLVETKKLAGASSNACFTYDPEAHTFTMSHYVIDDSVVDVMSAPELAIWRKPIAADLGGAWEILRSRKHTWESLNENQPGLWPFCTAWHRDMGDAALLYVHLFAGDRLLGFMALGFRDPTPPHPERVEVAHALANQAVVGLELTRLTQKLRENEARLTLAHDAAEIGTWDWNLNDNEVIWSKRNFDLWEHLTPDESSAALPAERVLRSIHPEDEDRVRRELEAAVSKGEPFRSEFRIRTASQEERWLAGLGCYIPGEGPVHGRMIGVNLDVTQRRLGEQAREANERAAATLAERSRIARDIHDTLAQQFTGVLIQLRALSRAVANQDDEAVDLHVGNCLDLAKAGLQEARRAVEALRPAELETNTLCDALELLGKLAKQQSGLGYEIQCDSTITVEAREEDELFRIAQEGIANVSKHAGASSIKIRFVRINENVVLSVADNGIGFDINAETEGFGLRGMRERAFSIGAALRVASSPEGSLVEVSLPNRRNT